MRPPFFEWRIVEEGIRPRVDDLVREYGGLGRVARDEMQLPAMDARQHLDEPIDVHCLFEAVAHRLVHERVVRDVAVAGNVVLAGRGIGEDGGHQVVRLHPLELRRDLRSAAAARHGKRNRRVPAPASGKHRRVQKRLHEDVAHGRRVQVAEDICEGERVLRPEGEHQRILGGGRLQLEVELAAKPLAERERPRAVDAAAERRVQDELHPAGFVEEPLEHERLLRRDHAKRRAALGQVVDDLRSGGFRDPGVGHQPLDEPATPSTPRH